MTDLWPFLISMAMCLVSAIAIGWNRERHGKDAGIGTHGLVTAGAMIFTLLSATQDRYSTTRIAAQVVSGIGFLGAGLILKRDEKHVSNLTTAASVWFSASIGMMIGYGKLAYAAAAIVYALIVLEIPRVKKFDQPKN